VTRARSQDGRDGHDRLARHARRASGALACAALGLAGCAADSARASASGREAPDSGAGSEAVAVESGGPPEARIAAGVAVASVARGGPGRASAIDGGDGTAYPGPPLPVCSDGQVLAILGAELSARVDVASAVRAGLASTSALDLAEKIITDDSVLEVEVQGETRETGIAPAPGGLDRQLVAEAGWAVQALAAQTAPALDTSYVNGEVLAHLLALALIDRLLGPSASDPRITDLLARVRPLVVQHVQAAIQAQSELEGACAGHLD
jgi:predicted outer membrane protein